MLKYQFLLVSDYILHDFPLYSYHVSCFAHIIKVPAPADANSSHSILYWALAQLAGWRQTK